MKQIHPQMITLPIVSTFNWKCHPLKIIHIDPNLPFPMGMPLMHLSKCNNASNIQRSPSSRKDEEQNEQGNVCLYKSPHYTNFTYSRESLTLFYWDAMDQKLRRNDGTVVNQQMKAMPVAVSNCIQWFFEQLPRSLSISTVMPADAHAAANMSVEVTCITHRGYRSSQINRITQNESYNITYPITDCKQSDNSIVLQWPPH